MPPTGIPSKPVPSVPARGLRLQIAIALLLALSAAPRAQARPSVYLELGPAYEYTNLIYRSSDLTYLGTLCDTCGEILVHDTLVVNSAPESSPGAYFKLAVGDTAAPGRYYSIEPQLRLENLLVTGHLNGAARWTMESGAFVGLDQRLDHSLDQRFGLSRRYDSEVFAALAGYRTDDLSWSADLRPRVQLDRVNSDTPDYLQNANGARLELTGSHLSETAGTADVDAYVGKKDYPDSALRDYREAYLGLRADQGLMGDLRASLDGEFERHGGDRQAERHDLFRRWEGEAELDWLGLDWSGRGRLQGEAYDYFNPDSIFFTSRIWRAEVGGGRHLTRSFEVELRPRMEWLRAPRLPGEEYRQISLVLGATWLSRGLVDVSFEAGRRHYIGPQVPDSAVALPLLPHSDYHFYSLSALASRALGPHLRLNGTLDYLAEVHDVPADNNHIVYVSAELGYGFRVWGR